VRKEQELEDNEFRGLISFFFRSVLGCLMDHRIIELRNFCRGPSMDVVDHGLLTDERLGWAERAAEKDF
jgi:hypothetical protein